jgi:hypothetical protein
LGAATAGGVVIHFAHWISPVGARHFMVHPGHKYSALEVTIRRIEPGTFLHEESGVLVVPGLKPNKIMQALYDVPTSQHCLCVKGEPSCWDDFARGWPEMGHLDEDATETLRRSHEARQGGPQARRVNFDDALRDLWAKVMRERGRYAGGEWYGFGGDAYRWRPPRDPSDGPRGTNPGARYDYDGTRRDDPRDPYYRPGDPGYYGSENWRNVPPPPPPPRDPPPRHHRGHPFGPDRARQILGVAYGATAAEVKAAHRKLAFDAHPDRAGEDTTARMAEINAARDVLLDP